MSGEMIQLADGRDVPKACVDALDAFEGVWPGATFHRARAAIVARVIEAYEADRIASITATMSAAAQQAQDHEDRR